MTADVQFNVAKPGSLPTKVAKYQRRRMYAAFVDAMQPAAGDAILDVGVTSDRSHDHSNYFEAWYPHKSSITALGVEDASFLEQVYPGVRYVHGSGLELPFEDASFDFVHSSAVIEHVGSYANQIRFLSEIWRVARRGLFVTTPNRWFPIEVHTVLPLVHYLPPAMFRRILVALGQDFFADEANLNLMSRNGMAKAARAAGMDGFSVGSVSLVGWPSNLLLIAKKPT